MTSDDRTAFNVAAVFAVIVCVVVGLTREVPSPGEQHAPVAGRTAAEIARGRDPAFVALHIRTPDDSKKEARRLAIDRLATVVATVSKPKFVKFVVLHPLRAGAESASISEDGPPWHMIVAADGAVTWTARGLRGEPSTPPGIPGPRAIESMHVAVLGWDGPGREAVAVSVRDLWIILAHEKGISAVTFADEVPGATIHLDEGFERARFVPSAAELKEFAR